MAGKTPLKELYQDIYSISSLHNVAISDSHISTGMEYIYHGNLNGWEVQRTCDQLILFINISLDNQKPDPIAWEGNKRVFSL